VYLDEVSAVFVRRGPENEDLIARLRIQCATAPLPVVAPDGDTTEAFNHWANAAAVLQALGRNDAAFESTKEALSIFQGGAFSEIYSPKRARYVRLNRNTCGPLRWRPMELSGHHWRRYTIVEAD
jgi:hypothetical protein